MLSKPLIIALIISLSFNALLIGISKHLYDAKAKAIYSLKEAEKTVLEQQKAYELANKACVIGDEGSASFWEEKQDNDKQKDSDISKIDSIPKMGTVSPKVGTIEEKANDEILTNNAVDIDSKLPDVLIGVLSETDRRVQRQTNSNP